MRVAVNVEQLLSRAPGGIGRYTAQVAGGVEGAVAFCARHPRPAVDAAVGRPGTVVLPVPRRLLYEAWHTGRGVAGPCSLAGALADVDVVHAPSVAVPPHERPPLVVTVHDAAPHLFPEAFTRTGLRFHRRGLAAARRRADLVLTDSEVAAEEIATLAGIARDRMVVVHLGVDPAVPAPDVAARLRGRWRLDERPYVLWVGSLEPRKDVGTLVAAMARLPRPRPARLVLAGPEGWLTAGLLDPADLGALGDDLVRTGRVGEEELWSLYAGATLLALPSLHEGYGLPVVEAMACGVPVVCSDIPVLAEVGGGAALAVAPGDVAAWTAAIEGLLADPAERSAMAAAGAVVAAGRTVASFVAATEACYRRVAG